MINKLVLMSFCVSYVIGSIPFGLIISSVFFKQDIRQQGSGNIGATNAFRLGGKVSGATTLLLDGLKGLIPTIMFATISSNCEIAAACGAVCGHIFSVFLRFKGGKGVATSMFCAFAVNPVVGAFSLCSWIATFILTRYSGLSSIIASISTVIASVAFSLVALNIKDHDIDIENFDTSSDIFMQLGYFVFISALVILKHASHIQNIYNSSIAEDAKDESNAGLSENKEHETIILNNEHEHEVILFDHIIRTDDIIEDQANQNCESVEGMSED